MSASSEAAAVNASSSTVGTAAASSLKADAEMVWSSEASGAGAVQLWAAGKVSVWLLKACAAPGLSSEAGTAGMASER
eukprot:9026075-Pyramimonas_sp.AAC.1